MQPIKHLAIWLSKNSDSKHYLFTFNDLRSISADLSDAAFKTLLSRTVQAHILTRVCRGIYLYVPAQPAEGLLLYHVAALLRADKFNYISLETALSDQGIISQIPINWISIMSSGRSNIVSCDEFGTIEFVHTNQKASDLINQLSYDEQCGMWRANVKQALKDMKTTRRNSDLIDWDTANELI